jgi:hypothetical protein
MRALAGPHGATAPPGRPGARPCAARHTPSASGAAAAAAPVAGRPRARRGPLPRAPAALPATGAGAAGAAPRLAGAGAAHDAAVAALLAPLTAAEAAAVESVLGAPSTADLAARAAEIRDRGHPRIMTFSPKVGGLGRGGGGQGGREGVDIGRGWGGAAAARRQGRLSRSALAAASYPPVASRPNVPTPPRPHAPTPPPKTQVFIPLTRLCRDACGYCTFARAPVPGRRAYMTLEEVLAVARLGAAQGCCEALFTLGALGVAGVGAGLRVQLSEGCECGR